MDLGLVCGVIGVVGIPVAVGLTMGATSLGEFRFVRGCFMLAAFLTFASAIWLTHKMPLGIVKLSTVGAIGALAAIGLVVAFDWVAQKQKIASPEPKILHQPDILIFPPVYRYKFTWQASSNLEMVISPDRPASETSPLRTAIPVFQIKNIGSAIAKDVTVEWTIDGIDLRKAVQNSERLKGFNSRITENKFIVLDGDVPEAVIAGLLNSQGFRGAIARPPRKGYFMAYSAQESVNIPYLAPEINNTGYQETDLPVEICQFLELYVVAAMLDGPPGKNISVPIGASVKWESPEGGKPIRYKIIADIMTTKGWTMVNGQVQNQTPDIETQIKFTVSKAP